MLKTILLIGSGSFIGGVSRYFVARAVQNTWITSFTAGTLIVNLSGCLLIGLLYGLFEKYNVLSDDIRFFATVGFCGSFTTFSTFAFENVALLRDGNWINASIYTGLSVFLGIFAVYAGRIIVKTL